MKILLVNPPGGELTMGLRHLARIEPLGLEVLGAAVADEEVALLDMECDRDLAGALERFQPDMVGASAQIAQTYSARAALQCAKDFNPDIMTVLGGHHATLCPQDFNAPCIDAIVLGEGVAAFQELVARRRLRRDFADVPGLAIPRAGELRFTPPRPLPTSLDHQPLPDRSLCAPYRSQYFYLTEAPVAAVQTSLGCSFPCNFCSCREFTRRRFIARSPELVVEDLSRIPEPFVLFCDDHSFLDARRMERLHDLIRERGIRKRYFAYSRADCVVQHPELFRKWADIGLEIIMTGLEAIDDSSMEAINKRATIAVNERALDILEECGIGVSAGFLILPEHTEADFERIDRYARARRNILLTELTPLTPLPGTELHRQLQGQTLTAHRELYDLTHFVLPTALPQRELYRLLRKYYLRVVWRAARRMRLYRRPRALLRRHMPRLFIGVLRVAAMMRRAHESVYAKPPQEHTGG